MKTKLINFHLFTAFTFSLFMSCDGINEPPFTVSKNPSVSPDGKTIAFSCYPGNGDKTQPGIYIMSIDGNNKKLVYPLKYGTLRNSISWNPSGRKILFEEGIITLQNNEFKEIIRNKISDLNKNAMNFTWAPDGKSLLYNIEDSVYVCDTLFLHSRKLSLIAYQVKWMPDGKTLTYIKNNEICIVDTLNYQEIQITNDGNKKGGLVSSPDGIIFSYINYNGGNEIWLVNADGNNPRLLIQECTGGYSWVPDSKAIVYSKEDDWDTFLWKIDIDGRNDIQISKE